MTKEFDNATSRVEACREAEPVTSAGNFAKLSPEKLIDFLNAEIDLINESEKKPGWTQWAIIGSLAAVLWLLLDLLERGNVNAENLPPLIIAAYLTAGAIDLCYGLLNPQSAPQQYSFRFKLSSEYSSRRALKIFVLILSTVMLSLVPRSRGYVTSLWLVLAGAVFCFVGITSIITLIVSYSRIPMPARVRLTFKIALFMWVLATLELATAYRYFDGVLSTPHGVSFADIKISILVIASLYLSAKLLHGAQVTPLLDDLVDIRRDLVLGRVDLDAAIRRADIALTGLKVNDVLQRDTSAFLQLFEQVEVRQQSAMRAYDSVLQKLGGAGSERSMEQLAALDEEFNGARSSLDSIKPLIIKARFVLARLNAQQAAMARISTEVRPEIETLRAKLEKALSDTELPVDNLLRKHKIAKEEIARLQESRAPQRSETELLPGKMK